MDDVIVINDIIRGKIRALSVDMGDWAGCRCQGDRPGLVRLSRSMMVFRVAALIKDASRRSAVVVLKERAVP